ncbi:hypothetical protein [Planomonospora venezuelensis]|uniref:DNA-binding transcriptional MerR regulator n=1 Tax=Planomonospora venezuelensis TaxID=1999 RepID=A0A841CXZ4_PLAVE|nr:hypothetical protein [Planomonospora venezuelensis]MBB5962169.1 DNA-binding transcriptional MerR regulator [Planomonospora venezuelensis]GIN00933.1 hypothetical protein Pve01_25910 [Planomonospora venezuelensis]
MTYDPKLAAALSGATLRQLAHWRKPSASRGAVLVPEISATRPVLYSFRDVVALRTCVKLRNDASLQKIRRALDTLRDDLKERDHLSSHRPDPGRRLRVVDPVLDPPKFWPDTM